MLRVLMEKVNSMQEHMGNVSREVETQRTSQKDMLRNQKHHDRNEECLLWTRQQTRHS